MELTSPTNLKLKFFEPTSINIGDMKKITSRRENGKLLVIPTGKGFLRGQKRHEIQVRVDVPRSRRRHHPSLRIRSFPMRKTSRKSTFEIFVLPRRRNHHRLRQTQNGQGRNPLKVLQRQRGDRPHDLRGKALRGKGGALYRGYDRQRKEGEPSGENSRSDSPRKNLRAREAFGLGVVEIEKFFCSNKGKKKGDAKQ